LDAVVLEAWPADVDASIAYRMEQQFHQEHNTWITRLDSEGRLLHADHFQIEVRIDAADRYPSLSGQSLTIPLYTVMDVEEIRDDYPLRPEYLSSPGGRVAI